MKNFNRMTEKRMEKVHGGFAAIAMCFAAFVLAPLAIGGVVGTSTAVAIKS